VSESDKPAIVAAYVAGEQVEAIMNRYDIRPGTLYKILMRAGIQKRRDCKPPFCPECGPWGRDPIYAKKLCKRHYTRQYAQSRRSATPAYENALDRNRGTVLAAFDAGATLRSLGAYYGLSGQSVKNWLDKQQVPPHLKTQNKGRARPRWSSPRSHSLNLGDERDLADWIANFELDEHALDQWETDGGASAERRSGGVSLPMNDAHAGTRRPKSCIIAVD
jgi:hypothetical protein